MARKFQFDEFTLDEARYRLQRGDRVLRLEKRPMELLLLLVERGGELVSRDEIAEELWGKDVFVDIDHSINTAVRKVRQVLRDDPEKPRYVETVVGKGYRFAAPLVCNDGSSSIQTQIEVLQAPTQAASESLPLASAPAEDVAVETQLEVPGARRSRRIGKWVWLAAGAIALAFVIALITAWVPPPVAPAVGGDNPTDG